jgi:hypothetical protein
LLHMLEEEGKKRFIADVLRIRRMRMRMIEKSEHRLVEKTRKYVF